MFLFLSRTLDLAASPLAWALVLAALGVSRRPALRLAPLAGAVLLYCFSIAPVANALVSRVEASAPAGYRPGAGYDAVVLLGGVVSHGATALAGAGGPAGPSLNDNVERLVTTFRLLRSGEVPRAILSGGRADPDDPVVEAEILAAELAAWGIARERLIVEGRARNTRENAVEVAEIAQAAGLRRLLVVTSAFHAERARDCFRAVDLEVDLLPVDRRAAAPWAARSLLPRPEQLDAATRALRELLGRVVYRVVGYGRA